MTLVRVRMLIYVSLRKMAQHNTGTMKNTTFVILMFASVHPWMKTWNWTKLTCQPPHRLRCQSTPPSSTISPFHFYLYTGRPGRVTTIWSIKCEYTTRVACKSPSSLCALHVDLRPLTRGYLDSSCITKNNLSCDDAALPSFHTLAALFELEFDVLSGVTRLINLTASRIWKCESVCRVEFETL